MKHRTIILLCALLSATTATTHRADGRTKPEEKKGKTEKRELERIPSTVFENLKNRVSRIELFSSNYGIIGLDMALQMAGGFWPRGSKQKYIFGGGLWFGAKKMVPDSNGIPTLVKLSVQGYNPNSGKSWMVPGAIQETATPLMADTSAQAIDRNRLYNSIDYSAQSGEPLDPTDRGRGGANWPVWQSRGLDRSQGYFGDYIADPAGRTLAAVPKGPAIISGEDIFCVYRDTDPTHYDINLDSAAKIRRGYPLGIQVEQTMYSWGFGAYADIIFISYRVINRSRDTLFDCAIAPMMDYDIGQAANDHASIVIPDKTSDTLNMAVQWTEAESGTYGYVGMKFLESPATDEKGFLRHDKPSYLPEEQLGLTTFQQWDISEDPYRPEQVYDFISDKTQRDIDVGPHDCRFLMSAGPFTMRPNDTARVIVALMCALPNGAANGSLSSMKNIVGLGEFAQSVYRNNFTIPSGVEYGRAHESEELSIIAIQPSVIARNRQGTIRYSLAKGSAASLSVVDIRGAELKRVELGVQDAGEHAAAFDAAGLQPGVYFLRIETSRGTVQRKLLVTE